MLILNWVHPLFNIISMFCCEAEGCCLICHQDLSVAVSVLFGVMQRCLSAIAVSFQQELTARDSNKNKQLETVTGTNS